MHGLIHTKGKSDSIFRIGRVGDRSPSPPQPDSPPILEALRYGVTAPSSHNTQPWRIELTSRTEARLYFDPERALPAADPPGRQGHISHGTLIEMTAIAATSLGYRTDVELLPDGEMSLPEFGTKPTAILRLVADSEQAVDPLFSQILGRRSSRLAHEGPPLTDEEQTRMQTEARFTGVEVGWVPGDLLPAVIDIAARAMTIEVNDRVVFDEYLQWFRFSDQELTEKGDGLDLDTSGLSGVSLTLARVFTKPRTWHRPYNRGPYLKGFVNSVRTTRALPTLTTEPNTMPD